MMRPDHTQMPLRIPHSLHVALKRAADVDGVSLNQYCLYLLARDGTTRAAELSRRGEDLLRFLAEAHRLQHALESGHQGLRTDAKTHG